MRWVCNALYGNRAMKNLTIQTRLIPSAFCGNSLPHFLKPRFKKLDIIMDHIIRTVLYKTKDKINYELFLLN